MKKILISVIAVAGVVAVISTTSATAQTQACPPGQSGNVPYCQVIPPLPAGCGKFTSKLSLLRGTFDRARSTISILAPITRIASGNIDISLRAAGRTSTFSGPIDSQNGRMRVIRTITGAQARLGTGILTLTYNGDADTRPQVVRLRAANNKARLVVNRPVISPTGLLTASGLVSSAARGVVRVQIEFVKRADGETVTLEYQAPISNGRWSLSEQLPASLIALIATRCGTVHSYTLFTGYLPRRMRGEMRALQVLPAL